MPNSTVKHLTVLAPYRNALRNCFQRWARRCNQPIWVSGVVTDSYYAITLGVGNGTYDSASVHEKAVAAQLPTMIFDGKMVHVVKAITDDWSEKAAEDDATQILTAMMAEEFKLPRRYQCERCGGTGEQEAGMPTPEGWGYSDKTGKCDRCKGVGVL